MFRITSEDEKLAKKLESNGTPLSKNWNIYTGCIVS